MCIDKIRQAVGAIVFKDNMYLLVHKVKLVNGKANKKDIEGYWDFVKGGVEEKDRDFEASVLRELKEETGSEDYQIINKFHSEICFDFPSDYIYSKQKTIMFYVKYTGDELVLKSQDAEIDEVKFFSRAEVIKLVKHMETSTFLKMTNW